MDGNRGGKEGGNGELNEKERRVKTCYPISNKLSPRQCSCHIAACDAVKNLL